MLPYEVDSTLTARQWIIMTSNLKHSEVLKCRFEDLSVYARDALRVMLGFQTMFYRKINLSKSSLHRVDSHRVLCCPIYTLSPLFTGRISPHCL